MRPGLTNLAWDTDFFGFSVGKIEGEIQNPSQVSAVEQLFTTNGHELAYYSSTKPLSKLVHDNHELDFVLVDRKTTYLKIVNPQLSIDSDITSFIANSATDKLNDLAIQSGEYSRFNVDHRIEPEKFREMYKLWIANSLNKKMAREVQIYSSGTDIAGFVTLGEKNQRADIGIIGVDHSYRRNGIGRTLMQSAEKWSYDHGYEFIQVVTQGDNYPACRLYESCGYHVDRREYFYHIWRKASSTVTR